MKIYIFVFTTVFAFLCNISLNTSAPTDSIDLANNVDARLKFSKLLNSIADVNKQRLNALKKYNELDRYNIADGILRSSRDNDPIVAVLFLNKSNPSNNILYEIFDSDLTNKDGDTPVRDVLQQIRDYYDDVSDPEEDVDLYVNTNNNMNTQNNINTNHINPENIYGNSNQVVKVGREPKDGEEIVPNKNIQRYNPKIPIKEYSDSETDDGEEIVKAIAKPQKKAQRKVKVPDVDMRNNKANPEMSEKQVLRIFKSCTKKAIKTCKKACKAASKAVCESYKCSSSMKKTFKKHCEKQCKEKFSSK